MSSMRLGRSSPWPLMNALCCFPLLSFFLSTAQAEPDVSVDTTEAKDSPNAIFFDELFVGLGVAAPNINLNVGLEDEESSFRANVEGSISLMVSYLGWGLSVGGRNGEPEKDPDRFGQTEYFDFQFHHYNRRFGVDVHWQQYRGFYLEDLGNDCARGDPCSLRPGLRIFSAGLSGYLVLDERYSLPSAFTHDARQIESAGSWMVMLAYNHSRFQNNGVLLPESSRLDLGEAGFLESGTFDTLTASGGYGYNYIWGRFFMSIAMLIGAGGQHRSYGLALDGTDKERGFAAATRVTARLAMGVAGDTHHFGAKAVADGPSSYIDDLQVRLVTSYFQVYYGYRFR